MASLAKLRFFFSLFFYVLPIAGFRILGAIVRAWMKKLPLGPSIWNAFAGTLMANTPPKQLQAILPSTLDVYNAWTLSQGNKSKVDVLAADGSTRLLWIGPEKGNKVILFLHGGGYVMPLSRGHLDWMEHVRNEAYTSRIELSVCFLAYGSFQRCRETKKIYADHPDLIPANPYPRQMVQAIFALRHLLSMGYKPSEIIIGGDSAGGHLSLSLIAHLHRHRTFRETTNSAIDLDGRIRGCFLVSPLSSFNFDTPPYKRWLSSDVLSRKVVGEWGDHLVRNSPWYEEISVGKGWGMALDVPESWWENIDVVDRVFVTGGYEEVFCDHVQQLAKMLRRNVAKGDVELYMANEAHDGPFMDFAAGRPPSETTRTITQFVITSFKDE